MHDLARAQRSVLLTVLAELHDVVVEEHPRVAAWLRHCMFPLTDGAEAFEVIADVEFDEWERSGDVQPLASLTSDELGFLLSYLRQQANDPRGLDHVVREALDSWIAELEEEAALRGPKATPPDLR
jgi:hypothetical protein